MNNPHIKRITKEFTDIQKTPHPETTVTLPDDQDLMLWHVVLIGPADSPYSGGKFGLKIVLPPNYPFAAPVVTFHTRIYHPNVTNDAAGDICIGLLKSDQWKPASKLSAVIDAVRGLLSRPNPDDPLEPRIAEQCTQRPAEFAKIATEFTKRYATAADPFKK